MLRSTLDPAQVQLVVAGVPYLTLPAEQVDIGRLLLDETQVDGPRARGGMLEALETVPGAAEQAESLLAEAGTLFRDWLLAKAPIVGRRPATQRMVLSDAKLAFVRDAAVADLTPLVQAQRAAAAPARRGPALYPE